MQFIKAERKKAKLRLALTGPSGSGKTYGALLMAKGIGGRVALIDTEKGSASLYTHLLDFDVLELSPPFTPERFIDAIKAAEGAGYSTLIIDSISHEWSGSGGCLEINEKIAASKYRGNTWSAWNETTPRHRAFLDKMTQADMHIIATIRSKTETAQQESSSGKKGVVKLGMKAEQRDGAEYEFTTVLDIIHDGHYAVASKDRTGLFTDKDPQAISAQTGEDLLKWLDCGAKPVDFKAMLNGCGTMQDLKAAWDSIPKELRPGFDALKNDAKARIEPPEATWEQRIQECGDNATLTALIAEMPESVQLDYDELIEKTYDLMR